MQTNIYELYKSAKYQRTIVAGTLQEAVAQVSEMTQPTFDVYEIRSYHLVEDTLFEVVQVN